MNLVLDSRKVQPGDIFFAVVGSATDGHKYIPQAIANGASVIVYDHDIPYAEEPGVVFIRVNDTLDALNEAAGSLNGWPGRKLTMFGVTGTNGKSSISYLISQIYSKYVSPCGYMGTIGAYLAGKRYPTFLTTPDIVPLQNSLKTFMDDGATAAAIEVSSHGLIQKRTGAVDFDYAIYTNLTREHLDYFHDMETYFESKNLFFKQLRPDALAIVNADDPYFDRIKATCTGTLLSYGIDADCDYKATDIVYSPEGMAFTINYDGKQYPVTTNLQVTYNLYNLLAVFAALQHAGVDPDDIIKEFAFIESIPGRMDEIRFGQDYRVIVDYAHTEDSFEKLLYYVRNDLPGIKRIITVNGLPGKRDSGNREIAGRLFSKYCDHSIVCEEDCRDESPLKIANEMFAGMSEGYSHEFIEDRYEAIQAAVDMAEPDDIVLVLGKGAEDYLDGVNGKKYWMGDDVAARKAVKTRMAREGFEISE